MPKTQGQAASYLPANLMGMTGAQMPQFPGMVTPQNDPLQGPGIDPKTGIPVGMPSPPGGLPGWGAMLAGQMPQVPGMQGGNSRTGSGNSGRGWVYNSGRGWLYYAGPGERQPAGYDPSWSRSPNESMAGEAPGMNGWQRNDLLEQQLAQQRAQQPGWGGMPSGQQLPAYLSGGGYDPQLFNAMRSAQIAQMLQQR